MLIRPFVKVMDCRKGGAFPDGRGKVLPLGGPVAWRTIWLKDIGTATNSAGELYAPGIDELLFVVPKYRDRFGALCVRLLKLLALQKGD